MEATLPPSTPGGSAPPLALVMGGGGARAAYQVGLLRAVARRFPDLEVPIITGVSAGAINAVHLAAHPGTFAEAVDDLAALWSELTVEQVFRVDARTLTVNAIRTALQLASGGRMGAPQFRSLVDTAPLHRFLHRTLHVQDGIVPGIQEKIASGRLRALAISTSSYSTARSKTWLQGADDVREWERPLRRTQRTAITLDHIMASTALPLFFPAVEIDGEWYGDGGIRLAAPLSPAIHLGAGRILAISTRFERVAVEAERPNVRGYPPPAQVIGQLMNAIFLDLLDHDAFRLERINELLREIPRHARSGHRIIDLVTVRPSVDLGRLANDFEVRLPRLFRFFVRGLGTRELESPDVVALLLFEPGYLQRLIEVGECDGEARLGEIETLLDPAAAAPPPAEPEAEPDPAARARKRRRRGPARPGPRVGRPSGTGGRPPGPREAGTPPAGQNPPEPTG